MARSKSSAVVGMFVVALGAFLVTGSLANGNSDDGFTVRIVLIGAVLVAMGVITLRRKPVRPAGADPLRVRQAPPDAPHAGAPYGDSPREPTGASGSSGPSRSGRRGDASAKQRIIESVLAGSIVAVISAVVTKLLS